MIQALLNIFRKSKTTQQTKFLSLIQQAINQENFELSESLSHFGDGYYNDPQYKNIELKVQNFNKNPNHDLIIILNNCYLPDEPQRAYIETHDGDEIPVDHLMTKEVKDLIFAKFNKQSLSKKKDQNVSSL